MRLYIAYIFLINTMKCLTNRARLGIVRMPKA
jgi:hypothetical protein